MLALGHDRSLVVAVALVASHEFCQMINISCSVIIFDNDLFGSRTLYCTGFLCSHTYTRVYRSLSFHTGSYNRSFCSQKRHRLTLHVRSHQRTVGIVVLKERDQGCRHREHHLRRYVHVIKHLTLIFLGLFSVTTGYIFTDEMSFFIQRLIRLSHMVVILFIGSHVYNFVCYPWILGIRLVDLSVRSLDKSIFIDPCIGSKGVDQTDVRSLRSLDRTHSSVMGVVDISNLKSGTVTGQTAGTQCGKTSLMSQLAQRVVLIHELRQLGRSEELFHSSCYRLDVDQRLR